jgi:uncharacterized protein (TIGR02217 family)
VIDEVEFPRELAYGTSGGPVFSTLVTRLSSGFEGRQQQWSHARLQFDAAPAVLNVDRLATLLKFFYARRGRARGFLFHDYTDHTSAADNQSPPTALDQVIGTGDGVTQSFQLVKNYGDAGATYTRDISRPVAASVLVSLDNVPQGSGWALNSLGQVFFSTAPASGVIIKAGFEFLVPVRFDTDFLETSIESYEGYNATGVPIIEMREVE